MIEPENNTQQSDEDDDLNDVELGPPACNLDGECESCQ